MIKRLIDFVFGKVRNADITGQLTHKEKNCPVAFTKPSSYILKVDAFMLGLDERRKKRG